MARTLRTKLTKIWQEKGKSIVFVTHNWYEASYLADRILVMKERPGRIVKEVTVHIDRPRSYEDPRVFEFSSHLVRDFLSLIGETSSPAPNSPPILGGVAAGRGGKTGAGVAGGKITNHPSPSLTKEGS